MIDTIDRFVTALVGIPEVKARLLSHLLPTLENQISHIVQPINEKINQLNEKLVESDLRTDDLEQYGRRHSLRISGIPEVDKEKTDLLICEFLHKELEIDIEPVEIDRSHRLGEKKQGYNRPIAVRFINYRLREYIYTNRRYLRPGLYINESLSKGRSKLFYKARQMKKQRLITDTWTRDGNIFVKTLDGSIKVCTRECHLPVTFAPLPPVTKDSVDVTGKPSSPSSTVPKTKPVSSSLKSASDSVNVETHAEIHQPGPTDHIEVLSSQPEPSQTLTLGTYN